MIYALLALGFTMVYGIIELINFAHFNIFMAGSSWALRAEAHGGGRGVPIADRIPPRGHAPAGPRLRHAAAAYWAWSSSDFAAPLRNVLGHGGDDHDDRRLLSSSSTSSCCPGAPRRRSSLDPAELASGRSRTGAITFKQLVSSSVGLVLMVIRRTSSCGHALGKAMQATAQDQEAARMMGIEVDRVVMLTFFLGSALAGAGEPDLRPLLQLHQLLHRLHRRPAGLYGGRARRYRQHPRRDAGRPLHRSHPVPGRPAPRREWTDVIIFSILITVMVLRPSGLLGVRAPQKA